MVLHMTDATSFFATLSDEQKLEAITDLTEIAYSLAVTLRTLEVFAHSSVEYSQLTDEPLDFTSVGLMLLSMRETDEDGKGPLTAKAQEALDHPKVTSFISETLDSIMAYAATQGIVPGFPTGTEDLDEGELQALIDYIEEALANGEIGIDGLDEALNS